MEVHVGRILNSTLSMALVTASFYLVGIFSIIWFAVDVLSCHVTRDPIGSRPLIAGAALLITLFASLSILVSTSHVGLARLDRDIWGWTITHRDPDAAPLFVALSWLISNGVTTAFVLGIATLLLLGKKVRLALWLVATSLGALLHAPIKAAFGRARPPEELSLWATDSTAFPSAHAFVAAIVFGAIAVVAWRAFESRAVRTGLASLAVTTAFGIGISRIWLGVHWFSDVIAGWSLGLAWLLMMIAFGRRLRTWGWLASLR